MPPSGVADLIADARTYFPTEEEPEITLEANPTSVETGRLQDFRSAGVNRVSLGIQALNDESLHALGREHSAVQAVAALELARGIFPRVSFDLIYARPGQNEQAWRQELETALSLVSGHLSLYQLTIETGTKFEALFRQGRIILPEEDEAARLYDMTGEIAAKHGLQAYEVSNYAVPGQESRHNLAYWRYRDYAGIGPGAHGRVTPGTEILATRRHRAPEIWAERVEENGTGLSSESVLQAEDLAREMLLMGLRLSSGVDEQAFQARTGCSLLDSVDREILRMCVEEGYLLHEGGTLAATPRGRMLLEAILGRLVL
jgi:oxygen-independent coproporphyrinogen-3 oxidase